MAWPVAQEATEVHRDDLVRGLRLTVRLRMEGRGEIELYPDQSEQFTPEVALPFCFGHIVSNERLIML